MSGSEAVIVSSLTAALTDLVQRGSVADEINRLVITATIERAAASDPELGQVLRACAIPRRFDATIVGVLRGEPGDDERNQQLVDEMGRYSFVRASSLQGYAYQRADARHVAAGVAPA